MYFAAKGNTADFGRCSRSFL